jgi:hypothetical protein
MATIHPVSGFGKRIMVGFGPQVLLFHTFIPSNPVTGFCGSKLKKARLCFSTILSLSGLRNQSFHYPEIVHYINEKRLNY